MKRLWPAVFAFAAASVVLLVLVPRVHPARKWQYEFGRSEAITRARGFAATLGLATAGWDAYVVDDTSDELEYYQRQHPEDEAARALSPYTVKVLLADPGADRSLSVRLYPNGGIAGWDRAETGSKRWDMSSMRASVDAAFRSIAGAGVSQYRLATDGAPNRTGLRFTWERSTASGPFQPTIDIVAHEGMVVHAETHLDFTNQFDSAFHAQDVTDWLSLIYFVMYFVMVLVVWVLYAAGSVRRRVDQRFAALAGVVNFIMAAAAIWYGGGMDRIRTAAPGPGISAFTTAGFRVLSAFLMTLAVVGGGFFAAGAARPKWSSLRLSFGRNIWSKAVGLSVTAGLLWAPLLALPPFLAAALLPTPRWSLTDTVALFSPLPILRTLDFPLHPTLLGFFGVLFALLVRRLPSPWLRSLILAPAAWLVFIGFNNVLHSPAAPVILEAALLAIAVWELCRRFDFLALVVSLTASSMLALAAPALLQPAAALQGMGWRLLALLASSLGLGLIMLWKAPDVVEFESSEAEPLLIQSDREELQSEFTIAQRAQREMLPSDPPRIPGFSLAASCRPAREVGGDLYDFLSFSHGRVGIAVADVSGKGVPAALYMTLTKGLLAATAQDNLELAVILEQINGHLCTVGRRKTFVTMAMGILDPAERTLEYARAGHNPAVWRRRSGATSLLISPGLGLGITPGKVFARTLAVEKLELESGDMVVFYSDGLTEAMNPTLEQFGEERLLSIVEKLDGMPALAARDAILAEVTRFLEGVHPQDDLTLVVLRVD